MAQPKLSVPIVSKCVNSTCIINYCRMVRSTVELGDRASEVPQIIWFVYAQLCIDSVCAAALATLAVLVTPP